AARAVSPELGWSDTKGENLGGRRREDQIHGRVFLVGGSGRWTSLSSAFTCFTGALFSISDAVAAQECYSIVCKAFLLVAYLVPKNSSQISNTHYKSVMPSPIRFVNCC